MAGPKLKYNDSFPGIVRSMRREGYSIKEIAAKLKVTKSTLMHWANGSRNRPSPLTLKKQTELADALKESKEEFIANVKASLGRRAIGFRYTETKTFGTIEKKKDGDKGKVKIQRFEKTEKELVPDVAACMAILTNLSDWKHRQSLEHTGKDGKPVEITGKDGKPLINGEVVTYMLPDNGRGDGKEKGKRQKAKGKG